MLKNALDWLVASGELYEKLVAFFSASSRKRRPGVSHGNAQREDGETRTGGLHFSAPSGENLDESGIITEPEI